MPWYVMLAVAVLLVGGAGSTGCNCEDQQAAVEKEEPTAGSVSDAGLKVHLDPETGEFLEEPPPGQEGGTASSRQGERAPLVEEPSPVEGGGTMIRLDDRFHAEFRATVDSDGKLKADCAPSVE